MTTDPHVLYVDDEASGPVVGALESADVEVTARDSVEDVAPALSEGDLDVVVTAARVRGGDAFEVTDRVREVAPDVPVILFDDVSLADVERSDVVLEYLPRSGDGALDRLVSLVSTVAVEPTQVAYPVPEDEQARIDALQAYDVESRDAVDAFDRLTKLIARHFDVDVAFVGLVDEHEERFVACEGANWTTLPREDTICTHTILEEEVMVVEDVREDPRFAANERLRELGVGSYAGARLTTPDGQAIGALCCIDHEPRAFTEAEIADLELFAAEATELLVLRRRLNEGATE